VQVQWQAFNAFNHANFDPPDSNYTDGPSFGTVTGVQESANVNGNSSSGRAIRIAAKFYF
jgi:hypothetical protein